MYHVSFFKPYHADKDDLRQGESSRVPTVVTSSYGQEVEEILVPQRIPRRGTHPSYDEYLVKWKGQPESQATWKHELSLWQYGDKIRAFHQDTMRKSQD